MARPKKNTVRPSGEQSGMEIRNQEEPVEPTEEVNKPLNNKIRNTIDELDGKGIAVSYPSNEAKWDNDLYERLNRLNK